MNNTAPGVELDEGERCSFVPLVASRKLCMPTPGMPDRIRREISHSRLKAGEVGARTRLYPSDSLRYHHGSIRFGLIPGAAPMALSHLENDGGGSSPGQCGV